MGLDIYLRNPSDPTYEEGRTEIEENLDLFLQQIEMILLTRKGEVLGLPDFGSSLDLYLWEFNVGASELENEVSRQINKYCSLSNKYDYSVIANVYETDDFRDTAVIDIAINGVTLLGLEIK